MVIGDRLVTIPSEALDEYIGYFLKNVGTPSRRYGILDQKKGYNEDAKALEALLLALPKDHFLKAPLDDSVYMEIELNGHGQTFSNAMMELTGITGAMLTIEGENNGEDTAVKQNKGADYHTLVLCSHLPRAMQHALLKFYPEMRGDDLFKRAQASIEQEKGDIEKGVYQEIVMKTLEKGIIPTPLLGAQYFGRLEGYIEKLEGPDDGTEAWKSLYEANEKIRAGKRRELMRSGFNIDSAEEVINEMDRLSQLRRSPSFQIHTEQGDREHVPYVTFYMDTVNELMPLFAPGGEMHGVFGRINCITHSGDFDLFRCWMRNYGKNEFHITRTKTPPKRGQVAVLKVNHGFRQLVYLNDPAPLEEVMKKTEGNIRDFRALSHDEKIRQGDGVMDAGFYKIVKEDGKEKKEKVSIEQIMHYEKTTLIIGSCGTGKTTFCLKLAESLMAKYDGEKYVPLLIRLREADERMYRGQGIDILQTDLDEILSFGLIGRDNNNHVSSDMSDIHKDQRMKAYKKEGYKFVFIFDGLDEFGHARADMINDSIRKLREHGKVIVTSRPSAESMIDISQNDVGVVFVDTNAVLNSIDNYITSRVPSDREPQRFIEYMKQQDEDIKKNWLYISILTEMYLDESFGIDLSNRMSLHEIISNGMDLFMWKHSLEKDPGLFKSKPGKRSGETEKEYIRRCAPYEAEDRRRFLNPLRPHVRAIGTYMTVNDAPIVPYNDIIKIIGGKWSLLTESRYRQGLAPSRFLE